MEIKIQLSRKTNDVEINMSLTPEEFRVIKSGIGWKISEETTRHSDHELTMKIEEQLDKIEL